MKLFVAALLAVTALASQSQAEVLNAFETQKLVEGSSESAKDADGDGFIDAYQDAAKSFSARFAGLKQAAEILGSDVVLTPTVQFIYLSTDGKWLSIDGILSATPEKKITDCPLAGQSNSHKKFHAEINNITGQILTKDVGYHHMSGCE